MANPVFQLNLTVAPFPTGWDGNLNEYATELVSLISASLAGSIIPGIYNPASDPSTYTSDQGVIFFEGQWYYWNAALPTPAYVLYSPATPTSPLSPNVLDNGDFQVWQRNGGASTFVNIGPDQWWTLGFTVWQLAGGAGFSVPAVGASHNAAVVSSAGATAGSNFYPGNNVIFPTGDEMSITAIPDGTHITFTNTGGATPGNAIANNAFIRVRQRSFLADRWNVFQDGTIISPPNQQLYPATILGTRANNNPNTSNCLRLTANATPVTVGVNQFLIAVQGLELQRAQILFDLNPSFSIWLRSSLGGTYCAFLQSAGADHSLVMPCVITTTGVWKQFTFPALKTIPYGSGNWGTNPSDFSMLVGICAASGSTFQQAPGNDKKWVTGKIYSDTNQTNLLGTALATLDICLAQLEPSGTSTAFNYLPFQSQLDRCQRYCSKSYPYATAIGAPLGGPFGAAMSMALTAGATYGGVRFPKEMRQTPQFLELYSPGDGAYYSALQNNSSAIDIALNGVQGLDAIGFMGLSSAALFGPGDFYSVEYLAEDGLL
jgi:hypothetical protein